MDIPDRVLEEVARSIYEGQRSRITDPGSINGERPWRSQSVTDHFWDGYLADAKAAVESYVRQMYK